MSINHFSPDLPDTLWWTQHQHHIMDPNNTNITSSISQQQQREAASWTSQHHQQQLYHSQVWLDSQQSASMLIRSPNPSHSFNLNVGDDDEVLDAADDGDNKSGVEAVVEKEAMFEKPLTPSDVGKLNRLVIPKQHAEKYFPLGGDSSDKGLLLSFEDESGKCWRFRYSYWNSSQSYVLTKGWSRYVKEKQLDAGDVVLFERHRTDADRFFIGWRRRVAAPAETVAQNSNSATAAAAGGEQWTRVYYSAHPYPTHPGHGHGPPVPYQPDCIHAGNGSIVPTTVPAGNLKRLRLFGVNLECQLDESEPSTPDGSLIEHTLVQKKTGQEDTCHKGIDGLGSRRACRFQEGRHGGDHEFGGGQGDRGAVGGGRGGGDGEPGAGNAAGGVGDDPRGGGQTRRTGGGGGGLSRD